jgi:MFS family permease
MKSVYFAGSFVGAVLGGALSDVRGRRSTLVHMWALTALGTTLAAASQHWLLYAAARFTLGITAKCAAPSASPPCPPPRPWNIIPRPSASVPMPT